MEEAAKDTFQAHSVRVVKTPHADMNRMIGPVKARYEFLSVETIRKVVEQMCEDYHIEKVCFKIIPENDDSYTYYGFVKIKGEV